ASRAPVVVAVSRGSDATIRVANDGCHTGRMELNAGKSAAEMIAIVHMMWRSDAARFRIANVRRNAVASITDGFIIMILPLSLLLRSIGRFDPVPLPKS